MMRKAMKDVTLSDGTFVPKGTLVVAPQYAVHHDKRNYSEPYTFRPDRFAREHSPRGWGPQYVTTTTDFIPFGHGKHAWYVTESSIILLPYSMPHIMMPLPVVLVVSLRLQI